MPDLATVQRRFAAALEDGAHGDDALPLFAGDAAHVRDRLAIYRRNVAANTARALAATYPIIGKLVGAEFFGGLARAYGRAHPSTSGDLNDFGACFADFVGAFAHTRQLPYLPDVARLEWLAHRAHYAADHAPLDASTLSSISEDDYMALAVTLHPAVALIASDYPLFRIWEVHQDDFRGEMEVDLGSGAERVVVYRPRFRATVGKAADGEFAFLTAIARGERLGTALASALEADAQFDLGANLTRWVAVNIVVGIEVTRADAR